MHFVEDLNQGLTFGGAHSRRRVGGAVWAGRRGGRNGRMWGEFIRHWSEGALEQLPNLFVAGRGCDELVSLQNAASISVDHECGVISGVQQNRVSLFRSYALEGE